MRDFLTCILSPQTGFDVSQTCFLGFHHRGLTVPKVFSRIPPPLWPHLAVLCQVIVVCRFPGSWGSASLPGSSRTRPADLRLSVPVTRFLLQPQVWTTKRGHLKTGSATARSSAAWTPSKSPSETRTWRNGAQRASRELLGTLNELPWNLGELPGSVLGPSTDFTAFGFFILQDSGFVHG